MTGFAKPFIIINICKFRKIKQQRKRPVMQISIEPKPHTLHITSGEAAAEALRHKLPQADIIPFNEAMCEGSACAEIFTNEFYQLRAAAYGVTLQSYLLKSPGGWLNAMLPAYKALNLYFDYDMFCVVNTITLLAFLEQAQYKGQINFYLLEANGGADIIDTWPVKLGIYNECYQQVLVNRQPFDAGKSYFNKGIELYLDYKKEANRITAYIAANSALDKQELLYKLMARFADYGLTDIAAARFIDAHLQKVADK